MHKTALITGPTNGIGRETALELGRQGYKLFLLCRNREAGKKLCAEIEAIPKAIRPHLLVADLGNYKEVRRAAYELLDTGEPLHLLINNAGIVNTKRIMVEDQEQMFRVNHLGHFLLTTLLLEKLKSSAPSRIIVVASDAHAFCKGIQFDDLTFDNNFSTFKTYGHSKLANMLMTRQLAKMLEGTEVTVNCLHPGAVSTGLGQNNPAWYAPLLKAVLSLFFLTPKEGAETTLFLATENITTSGNYYHKRETRGSKKWARDDVAAEKLWNLSKSLVSEIGNRDW